MVVHDGASSIRQLELTGTKPGDVATVIVDLGAVTVATTTVVNAVDVMVPVTEVVDRTVFVLVRVWTLVLGSVVVFVTYTTVFAVTVLGVD